MLANQLADAVGIDRPWRIIFGIPNAIASLAVEDLIGRNQNKPDVTLNARFGEGPDRLAVATDRELGLSCASVDICPRRGMDDQ